jgi:hypothetical protein
MFEVGDRVISDYFGEGNESGSNNALSTIETSYKGFQ